MFKKRIDFPSTKSAAEIKEEIRNLIRKEKFYPSHDPLEIKKLPFLFEPFSRNYKIQIEENTSPTQLSILGRMESKIELSIWIAAFVLIIILTRSLVVWEINSVILLPVIWIGWYTLVFYFPLKSDLLFLQSRLS